MGVSPVGDPQAHPGHASSYHGPADREPPVWRSGEVDATQLGDVHPEANGSGAAVQQARLGRDLEPFDNNVDDQPRAYSADLTGSGISRKPNFIVGVDVTGVRGQRQPDRLRGP